MNKKKTILTLLLALAASGLAVAGDHAHWGYSGHGGADHWGDMEPGFATCKLGKEQSPIDIRGAEKSALQPIRFSYAPGPAEVVNNGHTIQVNLAAGGEIGLASGTYKLLQYHFHTPSEEKVDGQAFPMVAHLVHKSAEGKLAVVAVLFKEGRENAALKSVFDTPPAKHGETRALEGGINPMSLLPADQAYYAYMGSLTTPPCSEGVFWQVLKTPVEISKAQLDAFKKLYPMNARPVQPLNGRKLQQN